MRVFVLVLPLAALAVLASGCRVEPRATPADAPAETVTPAAPRPAADAVRPPGEKPEVVLYVTEWCPYCAQARDYMAEQNIPHRVVDIEASAEGAEEYQAMGGQGGIPLVAVGTETIEGWSAEAAREMLDAAGYD